MKLLSFPIRWFFYFLQFFLPVFSVAITLFFNLPDDYQTSLTRYFFGDHRKTYKELMLMARNDDSDAMLEIGSLYEKGDSVEKDEKEAIKWYRLSANRGNVNGQSILALQYELGEGVSQNDMIAYMWYDISIKNASSTDLRETLNRSFSMRHRDTIAKGMTSENIIKAQAMAKDCVSSAYTICFD